MISRSELMSLLDDLLEDVLDFIPLDTLAQRELYDRVEYAWAELRDQKALNELPETGKFDEAPQCPVQ